MELFQFFKANESKISKLFVVFFLGLKHLKGLLPLFVVWYENVDMETMSAFAYVEKWWPMV